MAAKSEAARERQRAAWRKRYHERYKHTPGYLERANARSAEFRKVENADPERLEAKREYQRKYYQQHRSKALDYARKFKYGLKLGSFNQMLQDQAGRCAICDDPMITPHVDHNHSTGEVRGLLCARCNTGLSYVEKPGWWQAAQEYLVSPLKIAET